MSTTSLLTFRSSATVSETATRLESILKDKGMTVFARIDHARGAASIDESLRPTELVIFGNPQAGTKLMQASQLAGIDLPMKALVWEDEDGATWIGMNTPAFLRERHSLEGVDGVLGKIGEALSGIGNAAAETGAG